MSTLSRVDKMAGVMAEIGNEDAARILRQMVDTVVWVRDNGGPELTVAEEFIIAASKFERPDDLLKRLEAQREEQDAAGIIPTPPTPGREHPGQTDRNYKGWIIAPKNLHGWYVATDLRGTVFSTLKADTLAGIKQIITETIQEEGK